MFVAGLLLAVAAPPGPAAATTIEAAGYLFSDRAGGFELLGVSGSGSRTDPFVVLENYTGPGAAILSIHPPALAAAGSQRPYLQISLIKVVVNRTAKAWIGFELELQETERVPSDYWDGLSFDQLGTTSIDAFLSDRFDRGVLIAEPYDRVRFEGGGVDPGEAVRLHLVITDPTPTDRFFVQQQPAFLLSEWRSCPYSAGAACPPRKARNRS